MILWENAKELFRRVEKLIVAHPVLTIAVVVIIAAILAITRRPETLFHAQFWAEDGRYWYASAYNNGLSDVFAPYAGYFVLTYRIVAFFSLLLPFHFAPAFFNIAALGIQLLPVVLLCSGRLKKIIPYRSVGILLSLLYIAVPNSMEVYTNLTNIQWHLGIAAFLVLIAEKNQRLVWRIFDTGVLLITGFSGPLVIFLLPFAVFIWWRHKALHHLRRVYLLGALSVLQLIYIFIIDMTPRVGSVVAGDPFDLVKMIVGQVFTGGLLGQQYVNLAYGHNKTLVGLLLIGLGLMLYAFIKGPMWLKLLHTYGAMLIVGMLVSLRPVEGFDAWQGLTNPGGGQRYWYIPILIWLATLIWLAGRATLPIVKGAAISLLLLLVLVGIPRSWSIVPFPYLDFRAHALQFEQAPSGTMIRIPINPGWDMTLHKK